MTSSIPYLVVAAAVLFVVALGYWAFAFHRVAMRDRVRSS